MNNEDLNSLIYKALKLVSEDKYNHAKDMVDSILNNKSNLKLDMYHWQHIGDILLVCKEFERAINAYENANNHAGVAFVFIILANLNEAKKYLKDSSLSPAASWCQFLFELFSTKKIKKLPPFLQTRHFLEMTVYYLLLAENDLFIEILLKNLNRLIDSNLDSEKLIGCAYLNFGKLDEAEKFFINATKRNQLDGEIYFMLGKLYVMKNNYLAAMDMLQNANLLLNEHMPTKKLIEKVELKLSN